MKTTVLVLTAMAILPIASFAQPTINSGDVTPTIGSAVTGAEGTYVDPGSVGANQTWDLSGIVPENVSTTTYLAPTGLPGSSNFSSATHAVYFPVDVTDEIYGYVDIENNQIEDLGYYATGPELDLLYYYPDPKTVLVFPLAFNDSFSDTYQSEMETGDESGSILSVETGTIDALVDGYGTLITPEGTYTDVLRVQYIQTGNTVISVDGIESFSSENTSTEYQYYKSGYPMPLASVRTNVVTSMGTTVEETQSGAYFIGFSVGLAEKESPFNSVQVYPMPATTHIELNLNAKAGANTDFALLSSSGKTVHFWNQQVLNEGSNQLRFELPQLAAGNYLLQINTPEGMYTKRVVIGK